MNQPIKAMTPEQEARDKRFYTLTTIVSGTIKQTRHEDHEYVLDLADRTADLLIESGITDWAVFVEDQHRLQYHREWRNGESYREPYEAEPGPYVSHYVDGVAVIV